MVQLFSTQGVMIIEGEGQHLVRVGSPGTGLSENATIPSTASSSSSSATHQLTNQRRIIKMTGVKACRFQSSPA